MITLITYYGEGFRLQGRVNFRFLEIYYSASGITISNHRYTSTMRYERPNLTNGLKQEVQKLFLGRRIDRYQ